MKNKSAYTLIELLVSITIVALLVVLVVVNYSGLVAKSRDQRRLNDLTSIQLAVENYKFENKKCPFGNNEITEKLLSSKKDPKTGEPYYYKPSENCKYEICAFMETKRNLVDDFEYIEGEGEIYNYCLFGDKVNQEMSI